MSSAPRKILTVEDIFDLTRRGLVIVPDIPFDTFGTEAKPHKCSLELRRPDGSKRTVQAAFFLEHFNLTLEAHKQGAKSFHYVAISLTQRKKKYQSVRNYAKCVKTLSE